jgi:hypothetical protein
MANKILINILRFIALVLLQSLVINKLNLGPSIQAFVYPLFILLLPFNISGLALLFLSFFIGLSVDLFSATMGLHTAASVFIAFMRPKILNILEGLKNYSDFDMPGINNFGMMWFIQYTLLMMLMHNVVYFMLDAFSFSFFFSTLGRILIGTIASSLLIVLINILFKKNES